MSFRFPEMILGAWEPNWSVTALQWAREAGGLGNAYVSKSELHRQLPPITYIMWLTSGFLICKMGTCLWKDWQKCDHIM